MFNKKNRSHQPSLTRKNFLSQAGMGFGAMALSGLIQQEECQAQQKNVLLPKPPHFSPKAKNVIFLYMDGGPSQVDTFDYKPALKKYHGQDPKSVIGKLAPTQFNSIGKVTQSPFEFKQHGQSGLWMSSLFPHLSEVADDLCVIKSMTSQFEEHTFANYFLHTGSGLQGRPSMGSWFNYGLGSVCSNLPGYVVLNGGLIPPGGLDCFGNGFLPAAYQGSVFNQGSNPVANILSKDKQEVQLKKLDLLKKLDQEDQQRFGSIDAIESRILNYETAYRMQSAVPDLMDISDESEATKNLYGLNASFKNTQSFGRQCLIARRLVERDVRFIQLTCPGGNGDRWDQHSNLKEGHEKNALSVDQGIAGLIKDLKSRGLLDETLIIWSGEFGRTPFAQGSNGRDHNPHGFSLWMCGGGIKRGMSYGDTDEFGYKAVDKRLEIHDLHATMLHLMGINHTKSTYLWSGRDMRLTDVHGHIIHDIIA